MLFLNVLLVLSEDAQASDSVSQCPLALGDVIDGTWEFSKRGYCKDALCLTSTTDFAPQCSVKVKQHAINYITGGDMFWQFTLPATVIGTVGTIIVVTRSDEDFVAGSDWAGLSSVLGLSLGTLGIMANLGALAADPAKDQYPASAAVRIASRDAVVRQYQAIDAWKLCQDDFVSDPELSSKTDIARECHSVRKIALITPLIRDALAPALADIGKMEHAISVKDQSARTREGDWLAFYQNTRSGSAAPTMRGLDLPPPLESLWCSRWKAAVAVSDASLTPQLRSELTTYFQTCPS